MITFVKTVSRLMGGTVDLLRRASLARIVLLHLVAAPKMWRSSNILQWKKHISSAFESSSETLSLYIQNHILSIYYLKTWVYKIHKFVNVRVYKLYEISCIAKREQRIMAFGRGRWNYWISNSLKNKRMFYVRTQCVPHSEHSAVRLNTDLLMLRKKKFAVCSEIHTKHINEVWSTT